MDDLVSADSERHRDVQRSTLSKHGDVNPEIGDVQNGIGDAGSLVADDQANRKVIIGDGVVNASRRLFEGNDLSSTLPKLMEDVKGNGSVGPGYQVDGMNRRLGDFAPGPRRDPRWSGVAFDRWVAGDPTKVQSFGPNSVAEAKDHADVREAADIVADDGERVAGISQQSELARSSALKGRSRNVGPEGPRGESVPKTCSGLSRPSLGVTLL